MTHKTRAIILRSIKYGETSLVVTAFTELFGIQAYLVNGVRTAAKTGSKAILYQPATLLEMEVYHNELKNMHRIKESNRAFLYKNILSDVVKNSIALFMVELLQKTLRQPEQNNQLFYFCEDALIKLDEASPAVTANFALYFILQLSHFFGFRINDQDSPEGDFYLDLQEGNFTSSQPAHLHYLPPEDAWTTSEFLKMMQPHELSQLKLNHVKRRHLLSKYLEYYQLHIPDFGQMKTLAVMEGVL